MLLKISYLISIMIYWAELDNICKSKKHGGVLWTRE